MNRDRYKRLNRKVIYQNAWLAVEANDIVHPKGVPGEQLVVVTPQAAGVHGAAEPADEEFTVMRVVEAVALA